MITRAQKLRLGVFLIVSAALLLATLAVLAGLKLAERRDMYTVRYDISVSGLEVGAAVKYNGVRVGRVDTVRIDREDVSRVIVTLSLDPGTPIKTDTRAVINLTGITGLKFIELTLGSRESDFVEPGGVITAGESLVDRLTGRAEVIAEKAERVMNNLGELTEEENRERMLALVDEARDLLASTSQLVEENRDNVRAITSNLTIATGALGATLENLDRESARTFVALRETAETLSSTVDRAQVARILDNLERITGTTRRKLGEIEVAPLLAELQSLARRADRLMENLDLTVVKSREDLFGSLTYLLEGLENFSEFARMVRENPSLLLSGPREEERQL